MREEVTRGVLIIAAGFPQYGNYAVNLCMSIKATDPSMKVTLAHYGNATTGMCQHLHMFDSVVPIQREMITDKLGLDSFIRSKMFLDKLSPYDETIFFDADTIMFPDRKVSDLFDTMSGTHFMMGNRGWLKDNLKFKWSADDVLKAAHGDVEPYELSSEFVYFDRSKESNLIFEEARKWMDDPKCSYVMFAGGVPDEVPFTIAMMKLKYELKYSPFLPFFWENNESRKMYTLQTLMENKSYFGFSMGGSRITSMKMQVYEQLAKIFSRKFNLMYHYRPEEKRSFNLLRHLH